MCRRRRRSQRRIGAALARVSADQYASLADARAQDFEAVSVSLNGVGLAQLAIGVLGVLAMSGEDRDPPAAGPVRRAGPGARPATTCSPS
jgi:hypothetical protein